MIVNYVEGGKIKKTFLKEWGNVTQSCQVSTAHPVNAAKIKMKQPWDHAPSVTVPQNHLNPPLEPLQGLTAARQVGYR